MLTLKKTQKCMLLVCPDAFILGRNLVTFFAWRFRGGNAMTLHCHHDLTAVRMSMDCVGSTQSGLEQGDQIQPPQQACGETNPEGLSKDAQLN